MPSQAEYSGVLYESANKPRHLSRVCSKTTHQIRGSKPKFSKNYDTHTLAIRWCTVYRQGKVFSFPTTTNFFVDLDLSKILFHQHPLPQLKFMMQRIKISKLLVIAFRKHMTSRGLPTLRDVRVQRHRHSGNLRVSATD